MSTISDYCTFRMEVASDAHSIWANTACGKNQPGESIKIDTMVLQCI